MVSWRRIDWWWFCAAGVVRRRDIRRNAIWSSLKIWFVSLFSVRSGRRDADHDSLEWSRGDESIGGGFASSRSIDVEISDKT